MDWWEGKGIPLCRNCERPLTEPWDFPDICETFEAPHQIRAHEATPSSPPAER